MLISELILPIQTYICMDFSLDFMLYNLIFSVL